MDGIGREDGSHIYRGNKKERTCEYMYEENFPFTQTKIGEDPLHVVLKEVTLSVSGKNSLHIYNLVEALMKFSPQIDKFHLSRMALLQIVEPDNYQLII